MVENISSNFPTNYIDLSYIPNSVTFPNIGRRIHLDSDFGQLAVVDPDGNIVILELKIQSLFVLGASDGEMYGDITIIPGTGITITQNSSIGTITFSLSGSATTSMSRDFLLMGT